MRTMLLFSIPNAPKPFTMFSIISGDRTDKSSNHQHLVDNETCFISSGVVLADDENLKPEVVSGEDEDDEEEGIRLISEF